MCPDLTPAKSAKIGARRPEYLPINRSYDSAATSKLIEVRSYSGMARSRPLKALLWQEVSETTTCCHSNSSTQHEALKEHDESLEPVEGEHMRDMLVRSGDILSVGCRRRLEGDRLLCRFSASVDGEHGDFPA
jgi:hypothetical protein